LLVDYGGVMTSSVTASFAAFCVDTGVNPDVFKHVVAEAYGASGQEGMIARVERGTVSPRAFERWLADHLSEGLPQPLSSRGLRRRLFAKMERDDRMARAVDLLHDHDVATGLISNTWGAPTLVRRRELSRRFDVVIRSDEVRLRKPQPEIYLLAAARLGVSPSECVFVDDLLQNVEGARAVGMEAFVHRSAEFTIPKLEGLFCVSLG
jgi:epoxide hydrolase-like predicted phosphatase